MAGAFTVIDLSQLPAPTVVEQIDYEAILAQLLADYQARMADAGQPFTALLESDPIYKWAESVAYREVLLRQRNNESALAVMLAYAQKSDLDQLGANVNVARLLIQAGDPNAVPPTPDVYESDADFRARIQLSFEGYTTAGSEGSYVFHGLGASGDVKDIQAISPVPGDVTVYVLSRTGDGEASLETIEAVTAALNAEKVRPLTDNVTVLSATIVPYTVTAELVMYPGPDSTVVERAALEAMQEYADSVARIGYDVSLSGIYQALHRPGVQRVILTEPTADLALGDGVASYCSGITLTTSGVPDV